MLAGMLRLVCFLDFDACMTPLRQKNNGGGGDLSVAVKVV